MLARMQSVPVSFGAPLAGRVVSGLAALFVAIDGVMKLATPEPVVEEMAELGYPDRMAVGIGVLLLACLAVYLYPRTSILGAVLLTGYLGGAIASQVRIEAGLFSIIFPVILGAMFWGGLYLRDERMRALQRTAQRYARGATNATTDEDVTTADDDIPGKRYVPPAES